MFLQYSKIQIFIACTFVSMTFGLFKDYIDLLQLHDNDKFFWGKTDTESAQFNLSDYNDESLKEHSGLSKRQIGRPYSQALEENKDFGNCRTTFGEAGHCRHIIYCRLPDLKDDIWRLVSQLCIIEGKTIGICCPERIASRVGPQIITDINDNGLNGKASGGGRIVNKPEQRGCGITTKQFPRVTGGRPAEPDEWPWMAAILREGVPYIWCGGALITDRLILTAAHCLHKIPKASLFVRLGEYNTKAINETRARDFRIAAIVTHLDYDPLTFEHDIGLVRLNRAALFNTYIWPICLPPVGENWEGRAGVVTGWGAKTFSGPHSEILMEVLLPVWKHAECKAAMVERIPDTVLCAGVKEGGQDSCQGDSGGPFLVQLPNNRWVTIGIVSWGVRCGEPNRPGIYTRVDNYLRWIIENSDI